MRGFLYGLLISGVFLAFGGGVARAGDQTLYLWKNEREAHQAKVDDNAKQYEARGQSYVNHMYATQGEEEMPEPEMDIHSDSLADDAGTVDPQDVNLQDVQKILSPEDSARQMQ